MKKTWKLLLLALAVALLVGTFTILAFSEADAAEPSLQIKEFSLSLENAVYMNFKVSGENIKDVSEIKLLAWDEAPASYQKDTAEYVLATKGTEEETGYEQFQYTNLAAKDMTKMVYACAYYTDGETEVYSSPVKFSVAMYADMQKTAADPDEGLIVLIDQMLEYGAAAQTYFNYNTEFLATDEVHMVRVVNGKLSDGFTLGWYQEGSQITVTANEPAEGYVFSHWENSAGEEVGTEETVTLTVTKVDTYTAVYEEEISYFLYTELSDGTYGVKANPEATLPATLSIPASYNGKAVTQILPQGFINQKGISSVEFSENIKKIHDNPFIGCSGLGNILVDADNVNYEAKGKCLIQKDNKTLILGCKNSVIPTDGSVIAIGKSAFSGCSNLTEIEIPATISNIGNTAFYDCDSLTRISLPDSISIIASSVFSGCNNLTTVSAPGVVHIGSRAFYDCTKLSNLNVSSDLNRIEEYAFYGCSDLRGFEYLNKISVIASYAFYNCSSLESSAISSEITSIGTYGFYGCSSLNSITIDNTATRIPDFAFGDCSNLTDIIIGNNVTSISQVAFDGCSNLTNITFVENSKLTAIGNNTFRGCNIAKIELPESITYIGDSAFYNCTNLKNVTMGSNVTYIGSSAFQYSGIESIVIPDGVTQFRGYTFYGCANLKEVTIGNGVTRLYQNEFAECTSLTNITFGNSINYIGDSVFRGCTSLKNIIIPDSVTTIYTRAFENCTGLTSIAIPDSVTQIGYGAFNGCSSLTSVTIGSGVKSLIGETFCNCSNLTNVTISNSITSMSSYEFLGCTSLTDIYFIGTEEEWNAISKSSAQIPTTATIHYNYVPESE